MLVFFAAALPVIILFCGLSIDIGMLQLKKLQMQSAADAAALGAELEVERGTGNWVNMGRLEAAAAGFTNGSNGVTVTISTPPAYGPYLGLHDTLQATITQQTKTLFLGSLNNGLATVSANAVALVPPCAYFTNKTGTNTTSVWVASASITSSYCPVYANTAIGVDGFGTLGSFGIIVAGAAGASTISGSVWNAPYFNAAAETDPLASLASPVFSGICNHTSYTLSSSTATLQPGTYCKGITLTNSTVTLNPGLYVITGGATWNTSTVAGTGVTLFFTTGGGAAYGQFEVSNSTLTLSAPPDASGGGVPAVLIFSDRNWIKTAATDFQLHASSFYGDGIWYTTGTGISLQNCGNVNAPHYLAFDTDDSYVYATSLHPSGNFSNIPTGNPFRPLGGLVQ